jgi:hypothetical protein
MYYFWEDQGKVIEKTLPGQSCLIRVVLGIVPLGGAGSLLLVEVLLHANLVKTTDSWDNFPKLAYFTRLNLNIPSIMRQ